MLYQLTITDQELSGGAHLESFLIGIFRTRAEAESVARKYLTCVRGFCDYPCSYSITEKEVLGQADEEIDEVFLAIGWNTDEDIDETDVIESPCFSAKTQAAEAMKRMQAQYRRSEWTIQRRMIGQADWAEGFVR